VLDAKLAPKNQFLPIYNEDKKQMIWIVKFFQPWTRYQLTADASPASSKMSDLQI